MINTEGAAKGAGLSAIIARDKDGGGRDMSISDKKAGEISKNQLRSALESTVNMNVNAGITSGPEAIEKLRKAEQELNHTADKSTSPAKKDEPAEEKPLPKRYHPI